MSLPRRSAIVVATLLVVTASVGVFLVAPGGTTPEPAYFGDTVTVGMTMADRHALPPEAEIPKAQTFYTRYRYVVGFYGIEAAADPTARERRAQQFGEPLVTYVSDFADAGVTLSSEGYPVTDRSPGWVDAEQAVYVVDSETRVRARSVTVPFSDRAAAESFADQYGGSVLDWEQLQQREFEDAAGNVRQHVADRSARADQLVTAAEGHGDREVETIVGTDADTIQAAIEQTRRNGAVRVPPGQYELEEPIVIDRPITLLAQGATLRGDGNGSVIRIESDDAAVVGGELAGIGDETRDPDASEQDAREWDQNVELEYGYGDAGVTVVDSEGVLVADVEIETPANGILLRDAPETVVSNVSVRGTDVWMEGFMGVMAMHSPAVIADSTFRGGRDSVYSHRSHGLVVRNNTMTRGRYGVHLMYTSEVLIANNTMRNQQLQGIVVMTDPERNALVGNDIRGTRVGISTLGRDSYVAGNLLVNNSRGIQMAAQSTIYEHNVVAENRVGARTSLVVPTAQVTNNDFVDNEVPVDATAGPLRIWTTADGGNYWGNASETVGPTRNRAYSPTDPIDGRIHRVDGARTLARSPGVHALRGLRGTTPGLRSGSVVDAAPLAEPANPTLLEQVHEDRTNATAN